MTFERAEIAARVPQAPCAALQSLGTAGELHGLVLVRPADAVEAPGVERP